MKPSVVATILAASMLGGPAPSGGLSRPHRDPTPKKRMTRTGKRAQERRARQIKQNTLRTNRDI